MMDQKLKYTLLPTTEDAENNGQHSNNSYWSR